VVTLATPHRGFPYSAPCGAHFQICQLAFNVALPSEYYTSKFMHYLQTKANGHYGCQDWNYASNLCRRASDWTLLGSDKDCIVLNEYICIPPSSDTGQAVHDEDYDVDIGPFGNHSALYIKESGTYAPDHGAFWGVALVGSNHGKTTKVKFAGPGLSGAAAYVNGACSGSPDASACLPVYYAVLWALADPALK
jgi:hypothetical protein